MKFSHPQFLLLLLAIPFYIWTIFQARKKKKSIWISVFSDLKKARKFSVWHYLPQINHVLIILLIILFSTTLARPQGAHEKIMQNKQGIDIIIALDVSQSMLAEDLQPNRMEVAKEQILKFTNKIETDRIGIVIFSGVAFTQSPLTFDYNIISEYLNNISTDTISTRHPSLGGTAVGDAILAGIARFKKSDGRSKVMILLTDGDANTGADPIISAQAASEANIKIYTIGIGKPGGAPIPVTDVFGRKAYAQNPDGSTFMATFNETSLKEIAFITDGKYFRANDKNSLKTILEEINKLEKHEIKTEEYTQYTENYLNFAVILSIVFFIYISLNSWKTIKT